MKKYIKPNTDTVLMHTQHLLAGSDKFTFSADNSTGETTFSDEGATGDALGKDGGLSTFGIWEE